MPDITNYDGRLEQMAFYCEQMLDNIAKVNNAYHDSVETAYTTILPNHLIKMKGVKQIGGKTVVMNNILDCGDFTDATKWSASNCTTSVTDGVMTMTVDGTSPIPYIQRSVPVSFDKSHTFYVSAEIYNDVSSGAIAYPSMYGVNTVVDDVNAPVEQTTGFVHCKRIIKGTSGTESRVRISTENVAVAGTIQVKNYFIVDLTKLLGAGNEPQTCAEAEAILPALYYAYNKGTLLSAGIAEVVSKDSGDNVLQTYTVPAEILALEGYGWSCPGAYNYIDFGAKKFVQAVGSRAYEAGDESDATVITDGTNTYYELDEPLAFDVELPDETITEVESGGSITFENQHGDDYKIPVPVKMEYIGVWAT